MVEDRPIVSATQLSPKNLVLTIYHLWRYSRSLLRTKCIIDEYMRDIDTLCDSLWGPGSTYQNAFCTVYGRAMLDARFLHSSWAVWYDPIWSELVRFCRRKEDLPPCDGFSDPSDTYLKIQDGECKTNKEDEDVDKQRVGQTIVDAEVRELGPVDVVAVTVTVLHHWRRRSDVFVVLLPSSRHHVNDVWLPQP